MDFYYVENDRLHTVVLASRFAEAEEIAKKYFLDRGHRYQMDGPWQVRLLGVINKKGELINDQVNDLESYKKQVKETLTKAIEMLPFL